MGYLRNYNLEKIMIRKIKSVFKFSVIGIFSVLLISCGFNRHYYTDPLFEYVGFPEANNLVWPLNKPDTILFSTIEKDKLSTIIALDLSSGKIQTVLEVTNGILRIETISPDGNQIIFHTEEGTEGFERGGLWIMKMDTGQVKYFKNGDHAAWSPDSISVLVTEVESSSNDGTEKQVILNLVNMEEEEDNFHKFDNMDDAHRPSWAPSGHQVALSMSYADSRNPHIFEIDTRTWETIQITNGLGGLSPSWSPIGDIIAYKIRNDDIIVEGDLTFPSLFFINADSRCETSFAGIDSIQSPQWSPDGQKLIFIGPDGVYLFNIGPIISHTNFLGCSPS